MRLITPHFFVRYSVSSNLPMQPFMRFLFRYVAVAVLIFCFHDLMCLYATWPLVH